MARTWDVRIYRTLWGAKRRLKQIQAMQPENEFFIDSWIDFRYCIAMKMADGKVAYCT